MLLTIESTFKNSLRGFIIFVEADGIPTPACQVDVGGQLDSLSFIRAGFLTMKSHHLCSQPGKAFCAGDGDIAISILGVAGRLRGDDIGPIGQVYQQILRLAPATLMTITIGSAYIEFVHLS